MGVWGLGTLLHVLLGVGEWLRFHTPAWEEPVIALCGYQAVMGLGTGFDAITECCPFWKTNTDSQVVHPVSWSLYQIECLGKVLQCFGGQFRSGDDLIL
jgi:hypothetical protein